MTDGETAGVVVRPMREQDLVLAERASAKLFFEAEETLARALISNLLTFLSSLPTAMC